jgi:hypothetical protein
MRLKRNIEDPEQQHKAEAEVGQISGGGWDAQQQATVAAYARTRGMKPQEMLQPLVSSMEKTLRKERGESLTGQTPSPKESQRDEAGGKPEVKPSPERGKRESRDKDMESRCIACSKGKRKGIPPKARWKEEQKEKARGPRELQNEEWKGGTRDSGAIAEIKGKENRMEVASGSREAIAVPAHGRDKSRPIFEGVKGGAEGVEGETSKMPVACVSGVPRKPAHAGVVERVAPAGGSGGGPRSVANESTNKSFTQNTSSGRMHPSKNTSGRGYPTLERFTPFVKCSRC